MKRQLFFGLMLASAFALTNCTEQLVSPEQDDIIVDETIENGEPQEEGIRVPYEIFVDEPETKTISNGTGTYWVSEEVALANGLSIDDVDRISLFSISKDPSESEYTDHGKFTYAGQCRFVGQRGAIGKVNDWYCVYPYNELTQSTTSTTTTPSAIKARVNIGSADLVLDCADNRVHIAGKNYPMFGTIAGAAQNDVPRFTKMSHLSSLIALKVVNQGDSPGKDEMHVNRDGDEKNIVVKEVTFSVPTVSSTDAAGNPVKQTQIPIVGLFDATIPGKVESASFSAVSGNSNTIKITLPNEVTIAPGEDATFYFAIRPFGLDDVTRTNTGLILEVGINGSKKKVTIPDNAADFKPGTKHTIRVPVKLSYPKGSDALALTSRGRKNDDVAKKIITIGEARDMNINGENVPVYVVGENGKEGTITVRGFAPDMFAALPIGFYASCWNDLPTAMTLHSIQVWLPKYSDSTYSTITSRVALKNYDTGIGVLLWIAETFLGMELFDDTYGLTRQAIEGFVENIALMTFKGLVPNGDFDKNNVVIMDENPVYKEVKADRIDNFLKSFRAGVEEDVPVIDKETGQPKTDAEGKIVTEKKTITYTATCEGLLAMLVDAKINADGTFKYSTTEAQQSAEATSKAIYYKLYNTIKNKSEQLAPILNSFFTSPHDLQHKMRDAEIQVIIETRPYDDNGSTLNPVVLWGFDAYGPDASGPAVN